MSSLLFTIDPDGEKLNAGSMLNLETRSQMAKYFPDWDIHGANATFYRQLATNIYRCKDGRYFHVHGAFSTPRLSEVFRDLP